MWVGRKGNQSSQIPPADVLRPVCPSFYTPATGSVPLGSWEACGGRASRRGGRGECFPGASRRHHSPHLRLFCLPDRPPPFALGQRLQPHS